jgi:hypothetical protein
MERIDDSASLELLRRANSCFGRFFEQFANPTALGADEELRALLQVHEMLESVGALLDGGLQSASHRDVREALGCYRQNLIHLRRELAIMQQATIARRALLDSHRQHLYGIKAWCAVSRAIS